MKKFIHIVGAVALSLFFMYVGAILGSYGATYFMLCNTKAEWIQLITNIPDKNMWLFALAMILSGVLNFVFAMYIFTTIYKNKPKV